MSKYQIGDQVMIRPDIDTINRSIPPTINNQMSKAGGTVITISNIYHRNGRDTYQTEDTGPITYTWWREEWLLPYEGDTQFADIDPDILQTIF